MYQLNRRKIKKCIAVFCFILIMVSLVSCGKDGKDGKNGQSAYELAMANGFKGTLTDWLSTLKGEVGPTGSTGKSAYELAQEQGYTGTLGEWLASLIGEVGKDGTNGTDGQSAYELAVNNGFTGTVTEWLASLVGAQGLDGENGQDGASAYELAKKQGYTGTLSEWLVSLVGEAGKDGMNGADGASAYELAVNNGYRGTEEEWLLSLVGHNGKDGIAGMTAYELAMANGFEGTLTEWLDSLVGENGQNGASAYELAKEQGYSGTLQEWLVSLVGESGIDGKDGVNGQSAYELAVAKGYIGTEEDWLLSLVGHNGKDGVNGQSAYELAVAKGYQGTEEEWLLSLTGKDGTSGQSAYELAKENGFEGTLVEWLDGLVGQAGTDGQDGASAYELAVANGFEGTLTEWLVSLVGRDGTNGTDGQNGASAYELAVANGFKGTLTEWLVTLVGQAGADGQDGQSAYELAVNKGYTGTEEEWLNSLVGKKGEDGATWLNRDGMPETSDGKDGDFYIDTLTYQIYKKENGVWHILGNIKGEQGEQGIQGVGIENIVIDYMGIVTITLTNGSQYSLEVSQACTHSSLTTVVIAPTCVEKGYTQYTCQDCGYIYYNDYTPASGHHFYNRYCVFCHVEEDFGEITPDTSWYNTTSNTFYLSTREELAGLAYLVNISGNNFSNKTIYLDAHIDLASAEWIPIGTSKTAFAGTFIGQNLTISNLKITQSSLTSHIGFFGNVSGTIKDFSITGAHIATELEGSHIGIACGYSKGMVSGVKVSGYLDAPHFTEVGGVVGRIEAKENVTFTNLENTASISGQSYVGGVIGYFNVTANLNQNPTAYITSCTNAGKVMATSDYVGGLFGYVYANNGYNYRNEILCMSDLKNTGAVLAENAAYVGGIVGYARSDDNTSYLKNAISSATITGKVYVGGIAGKLDNIALNHCNNENSTLSASYIVDSNYYAYFGGYVGYGYKVDNCINTVDLQYSYKGQYVGGIAGYLVGEATNCTNHATIQAIESSYVGGIAGYSGAKESVTFTNLHNSGPISGATYVGGIIGNINGVSSNNADNTMNITECSNSGIVFATGDYAGGLFGSVYVNNSSRNTIIYMVELQNTGAVMAEQSTHVGGIAGYVRSDDAASYLMSCTNEATITGLENEDHLILVGVLTNVTIKES